MFNLKDHVHNGEMTFIIKSHITFEVDCEKVKLNEFRKQKQERHNPPQYCKQAKWPYSDLHLAANLRQLWILSREGLFPHSSLHPQYPIVGGGGGGRGSERG